MSCPKCETGLLVIETVTTGGFQFEQWRCVNCGKRMNEEEYMGWTEEQRKQHSERMKKNWDQRPRGTKKFKPVALTLDETGDIEQIQLPEKFSELTPFTDEAEGGLPDGFIKEPCPAAKKMHDPWAEAEAKAREAYERQRANAETVSKPIDIEVGAQTTQEVAIEVIDAKIETYRQAIAVLESAKEMLLA